MKIYLNFNRVVPACPACFVLHEYKTISVFVLCGTWWQCHGGTAQRRGVVECMQVLILLSSHTKSNVLWTHASTTPPDAGQAFRSCSYHPFLYRRIQWPAPISGWFHGWHTLLAPVEFMFLSIPRSHWHCSWWWLPIIDHISCIHNRWKWGKWGKFPGTSRGGTHGTRGCHTHSYIYIYIHMYCIAISTASRAGRSP